MRHVRSSPIFGREEKKIDLGLTGHREKSSSQELDVLLSSQHVLAFKMGEKRRAIVGEGNVGLLHAMKPALGCDGMPWRSYAVHLNIFGRMCV